MECVKFGTVMRVGTPEAPGYFGCVCVTFDVSSGADECAKAMHGRYTQAIAAIPTLYLKVGRVTDNA